MKILPQTLITLLALTYLSQAEVKKKSLSIEGKTYKECTISLADASTAKILHSTGIARVPAASLSAELQQQLNYNPQADQKRRQTIQKNATEAKARKELLAKAKEKKLWVHSNTSTGLIVGHYDARNIVRASSSARVGGGGGSYSYTSYSKNFKYAFIPHNQNTRNMTTDQSFFAIVAQEGTQRINSQDVVPKYTLIKIVDKKKSPKK